MDLTCLPSVVMSTVIFVSVWIAVAQHTRQRGPNTAARLLIKANSYFYSFVSLLLFLYIVQSKSTKEWSNSGAGYLYHLSKFWEYIDIILVTATRGTIDLHFAFHHLTTPYLTYVRVIRYAEGGTWKGFAALNTLHHVLMYAFFGGWNFLRPALPFTGCLQLVAGILVEIWEIQRKFTKTEKNDGIWPHLVTGGLLACYLILFIRDLRMRST